MITALLDHSIFPRGALIDVTTDYRPWPCIFLSTLTDLFSFQELDYSEFKMFAMACIDRRSEIESSGENKSNALIDSARRLCKSCSIM